MIEITLKTAESLVSEITYFATTSTKAGNHDKMKAFSIIRNMDELIRAHRGISRFTEDNVKIILSEEIIHNFNSIERHL